MTPAQAFGQILPLLAPALTALAAGAALHPRLRWAPGGLLAFAAVADLALSVTAPVLNGTLGGAESTLLTWSPLGLYGASVIVRRTSYVALLTCPALLLAWVGLVLAERRRRWFSGRTDEPLAARAARGAALLALAGGVWSVRAADFVSAYFGLSLFLVATTLLLALTAGRWAAGRRMVVVHATLAALLSAGLLLGKVNGHFQLGGLSSSGFTGFVFFGLGLAAAAAAAVPPFHGWLLRCCRSALAPALAAAGLSAAGALLLIAILAVEPDATWQGPLRALGWLAACVGGVVVLTRHRPAIALAAAWIARAGALFLAASIATPAAVTAAAAFTALPLVAHGALWLTAALPWGGHVRTRTIARPALRNPGFWINLLVLATAAGLPPTVGGTVRALLAGALTSWPSGDQLLRVPLVLADLATLIAGSALLWSPRYLPPLDGRRGWAAVVALGGVLVLPALAPQWLLSPWLDPAAAALAGTSVS
ncbi:MAG TPA: hypothetical protein VFN74_19020, partial [Chloroflexota bacterium]|nr:hypothetical protein [Chloroflexota bacterium]